VSTAVRILVAAAAIALMVLIGARFERIVMRMPNLALRIAAALGLLLMLGLCLAALFAATVAP
jgi:hypothetical protein